MSLALDRELRHTTKILRAHYQAPWCDGLPLLVHREWRLSRSQLLSPALKDPSTYLLRSPRDSYARTRESLERVAQKEAAPELSTNVVAAQQANDAVSRFLSVYVQVKESAHTHTRTHAHTLPLLPLLPLPLYSFALLWIR